MRRFRKSQVVSIVALLLAGTFSPVYGAGPASAKAPTTALSPAIIHHWGYDAATTTLLLELFHGGQHTGEASVCWQLLDYVQAFRPTIAWAALTTRGYTQPRLGGGYDVRLDVRLQAGLGELELRSRAASTLAHEVRHAMWNSIWDSNEEEYYCERTAGLAYQEMLLAGGCSADEAAFRARIVYPELEMDAASWVARFDWAPSGFDWAWQSDMARAALDTLTLFWPGGHWGHPLAMSDRALGR